MMDRWIVRVVKVMMLIMMMMVRMTIVMKIRLFW